MKSSLEVLHKAMDAVNVKDPQRLAAGLSWIRSFVTVRWLHKYHSTEHTHICCFFWNPNIHHM